MLVCSTVVVVHFNKLCQTSENRRALLRGLLRRLRDTPNTAAAAATVCACLLIMVNFNHHRVLYATRKTSLWLLSLYICCAQLSSHITYIYTTLNVQHLYTNIKLFASLTSMRASAIFLCAAHKQCIYGVHYVQGALLWWDISLFKL